MTFLLDINVLIALIDPTHLNHNAAHNWFNAQGYRSWATCPITENGLLRIVGHPKYPNTPGAPAVVAPVLQGLCAMPGHVFWPDDISLLDPSHADATRILAHGHVTDTYLLALTMAHGGKLATFDRRLSAGAVPGGAASLCQLPDV